MAAMARSPLLLVAALVSVFFSHAAGILTLDPVQADVTAGDGDGTKVYIVFTERQPATAELPELEASAAVSSFHHDMLSDLLDDSASVADRIVYHYSRSLHGFAARLTEDERNMLTGKDRVLSIHERVVYSQQTTRSWDFLGLPLHEHSTSLSIEKDVIIAILDTGVSMDSASFSDEGLAPPPAKWKGRCSQYINCTNKIIGFWSYNQGLPDDELFPLDTEGHGTHMASIAAGRVVSNASLHGLGNGAARGATPGARLAIYKVCWPEKGCASEDILAAMDDAIADGVDVISASIASYFVVEYSDDALAVGAFHAARRGVVTSVPAGNCGPTLGTITNVAPWMISTAATTTDRKIVSKVVLGNGKHFLGNSINTFPDSVNRALIVDPGNLEELKGERYKGAILLHPSRKAFFEFVAFDTGAAGVILPEEADDSKSYSMPIAVVKQSQFEEILDYYNSTRRPVVSIWNSETVFDAEAPLVAGFSSRGPNLIAPGILKPDISAPGVEILAAWSSLNVQSMRHGDQRRVPYNTISGTSVATPHVTGVAAYVKSVHPDWSPAAIISALITTAKPIHAKILEAEFAYGAGQVNPAGALDPGLVYDTTVADYISFVCAQGYNATQIAALTGTINATCPTSSMAAEQLNYPSIAVPVPNYGVDFSAIIPRTVTNVGPADSISIKAEIIRSYIELRQGDSPNQIVASAVMPTAAMDANTIRIRIFGPGVHCNCNLLPPAWRTRSGHQDQGLLHSTAAVMPCAAIDMPIS
ncbi:hypothetical protein PR202_gb12675 [Eleusine coracana subsp. coracana]|uniref:Uncharacterized protein n=1 Tax=Eleusine coracana subsp. coracana TaxID=191504 RepID=A0AAV5ENC6_ELECO|nr:hypothetical protein PR202_gb12675 [Eleusine coracana subsp. coracana]